MLTYPMEERGDLPLYEYLYRRIREDILSGKLTAGERLPSKRALAEHLHLSVITVEGAYAQLEAEGYLYTLPKRGFFVSQVDRTPAPQAPEPPAIPEPEAARTWRLDLKSNQVDTARFPVSTWARLTRQVLSEDGTALLRPVPHQGLEALRRAIADDLRDYRGMSVSPEQIIVGAGAEYLYLLGPGAVFAAEDPGYPKIRQVYGKCGAACRPVPLDAQGMDLAALTASGATVAHLSPSHHYPTGLVTPIARRQALLRWAEQVDGFIIEDDYDSEFRYHSRPIPSIASLSPGDNVVYMGTLSKILSPGLRVSYMVLPPPLAQVYDREFAEYPASVSMLEQRVLEQFLASERWEAHLRRVCTANRKKHDLLVRCLKEELGGRFAVRGENAGLHLMVQSLEGRGEEELIRRALERQVRVYPVSRYWMERERYGGDMVLLGFAGLSEGEIGEGVRLLGKAWGEGC